MDILTAVVQLLAKSGPDYSDVNHLASLVRQHPFDPEVTGIFHDALRDHGVEPDVSKHPSDWDWRDQHFADLNRAFGAANFQYGQHEQMLRNFPLHPVRWDWNDEPMASPPREWRSHSTHWGFDDDELEATRGHPGSGHWADPTNPVRHAQYQEAVRHRNEAMGAFRESLPLHNEDEGINRIAADMHAIQYPEHANAFYRQWHAQRFGIPEDVKRVKIFTEKDFAFTEASLVSLPSNPASIHQMMHKGVSPITGEKFGHLGPSPLHPASEQWAGPPPLRDMHEDNMLLPPEHRMHVPEDHPDAGWMKLHDEMMENFPASPTDWPNRENLANTNNRTSWAQASHREHGQWMAAARHRYEAMVNLGHHIAAVNATGMADLPPDQEREGSGMGDERAHQLAVSSLSIAGGQGAHNRQYANRWYRRAYGKIE